MQCSEAKWTAAAACGCGGGGGRRQRDNRQADETDSDSAAVQWSGDGGRRDSERSAVKAIAAAPLSVCWSSLPVSHRRCPFVHCTGRRFACLLCSSFLLSVCLLLLFVCCFSLREVQVSAGRADRQTLRAAAAASLAASATTEHEGQVNQSTKRETHAARAPTHCTAPTHDTGKKHVANGDETRSSDSSSSATAAVPALHRTHTRAQ